MPIAKNIKYCRKKAKLSQEKFAEAVGVTKATVISWESKKTAVPVPSAKRVAKFFGISFIEFCDIDMELLDSYASEPLRLTETETQSLKMFRELPDNIKEVIRAAIIVSYQNNIGMPEG